MEKLRLCGVKKLTPFVDLIKSRVGIWSKVCLPPESMVLNTVPYYL